MGQAFGKKFDKKAKAAVAELSSEKVLQYLNTGKVEVNGLEIVTGMLTISKAFKPEYQKSKQWAVASNMKSSVMLDVIQTDELRHIGISREVTNRIQRLRKTSGISIDDQIEIFYSFKKESNDGLKSIVRKYADKVMAQTRMPFLDHKEQQGKQQLVGETEFVHPEDEDDQVQLKIFLAAPKMTAKFQQDFGADAEVLQSYLFQFDRKALRAQANGITVDLNGKVHTLKHKEHFYFDARDMMAHAK
jgi:hypothetical protein